MLFRSGWGFVFNNEYGEPLVAAAGKLSHIANSLQAEAYAMKYAIQEAARMGCVNIILETDAMNLKQAMISDDMDDSELGAMFTEMKCIIRTSFKCCKIEWCSRSCNSVAHCLAAYGVSQEFGSYQLWLAPFPCIVKNLLAGVCPAYLV